MQNEWRGHGEIMWKRKNDLKAECVLREAGTGSGARGCSRMPREGCPGLVS